MAKGDKRDYVDNFAAEWKRTRPEIDVDGQMGVLRIIRIANYWERRLGQISAAYGLKIGQFNVLTALRRLDPQPLAPKDLMKTTLFSSGALTPILDKLEEKGLITRLPDPHDRRGTLAAMTDKGREIIDAAINDRVRENLDLASTLTKPERDALSELTRKLLVSLEFGFPKNENDGS